MVKIGVHSKTDVLKELTYSRNATASLMYSALAMLAKIQSIKMHWFWQKWVVLTQGKFPIYSDSFLDAFPSERLFSGADLALSLFSVSLEAASFMATLLSRSTEPVRTASKSSSASAILSKSCVTLQQSNSHYMLLFVNFNASHCKISINKTLTLYQKERENIEFTTVGERTEGQFNLLIFFIITSK